MHNHKLFIIKYFIIFSVGWRRDDLYQNASQKVLRTTMEWKWYNVATSGFGLPPVHRIYKKDTVPVMVPDLLSRIRGRLGFDQGTWERGLPHGSSPNYAALITPVGLTDRDMDRSWYAMNPLGICECNHWCLFCFYSFSLNTTSLFAHFIIDVYCWKDFSLLALRHNRKWGKIHSKNVNSS